MEILLYIIVAVFAFVGCTLFTIDTIKLYKDTEDILNEKPRN